MAHTSRGCPIQSRWKTWGGETSRVIVKLGRKAAAVTGQIVDADNSQAVVTARIRIPKPANDRIMMSIGADRCYSTEFGGNDRVNGKASKVARGPEMKFLKGLLAMSGGGSFSPDCHKAPGSSSFGHGTITNGSDIQASR